MQRSMNQGLEQLVISQIHNFFLMTGLYAVNFLTIAMAVLTSVDTLAGEISSGTIQTLVTKPARRWEFLMGKWIGFAIMMTIYLLMMAGGTLAIVFAITGYSAPNSLQGIFLIWLNALLLLSISFFGGSFLSTLANGVLAFGLFGLGFIGGWIEQIGSFLNNQAAVQIGIISSLIFPSEALWKRAAYLMQSPMVAMMGFSPFTSNSIPSPIMVFYSLIYILSILALAIRIFNRRDL
jgi:ABC-type transport system involved in multi-copper enzyme maturation permease subunit